MNNALRIFTATYRTLQVIIVFILSLILYLVQMNESNFKYRWSFESCNFNDNNPEGEDNILKTLKKIWKMKRG
jgi:hypothetical protein